MLDLLDVGLEPLDDRRVVVDDLVEDRPQHRGRALLEQLRAGLQPQPRAVQVAGDALAHGDDEAGADEDRDLAELDLLALVDVARGAQHDERDAALVGLDLGPQVEALRVLDGELVQAEDVLHARELLRRTARPCPSQTKPGSSLADRRRLLGRHLALVLAAPVAVVRAVDDHRTCEVFQRRLECVGDVGDAFDSSATSSARRNGAPRRARRPRAARSCWRARTAPAGRRCRGRRAPERSTISGPGASSSSVGATRIGVGAVDLAAAAGRPVTRSQWSTSTAAGPGRRRASPAAAAARPVADADGRAVGALVDVDRVHQRAHDAQPAAAVARIGGRRPPAPAVAHDERQHAARLARERDLDRPRRSRPAGRRARPRSRTARPPRARPARRRPRSTPAAGQPRPHRLAHDARAGPPARRTTAAAARRQRSARARPAARRRRGSGCPSANSASSSARAERLGRQPGGRPRPPPPAAPCRRRAARRGARSRRRSRASASRPRAPARSRPRRRARARGPAARRARPRGSACRRRRRPAAAADGPAHA